MTEWKAKRFWKAVETAAVENGFEVRLDGRPVRTPAKRPLQVPGEAMAARIAEEWDAQKDEIRPATMPFTRSANAAIDKVATQLDEVIDIIAAYGDADLTCYRAEAPDGLVLRQAATWDPLLDRLEAEIGVRLTPRAGVMHAPQDPEALQLLRAYVARQTAFQLTAFHDLVSLSGSLVIGIAAVEGWQDREALWDASRVDEEWQIEQWGRDAEADALSESRRVEFLHADEFFRLSAPGLRKH